MAGSDLKADLQSQVEKIGASVKSKNPEETVNFYTEDCRVFAPEAPSVQGREALKSFINAMTKFTENMGNVEETVIDVLSGGPDLATSLNKVTSYSAEGNVVNSNKSITVWKKVSGDWLVHWICWNGSKPTAVPGA